MNANVEKANLLSAIEKICQFLLESGVPRESISKLKEREAEGEYVETLMATQRVSHCFPRMDMPKFISMLCSAWEKLCEMNSVERSNAHRKIQIIKSDPKADPDVLADAEAEKERITGVCTQSNTGLYKIRILKSLYTDKRKGRWNGVGSYKLK